MMICAVRFGPAANVWRRDDAEDTVAAVPAELRGVRGPLRHVLQPHGDRPPHARGHQAHGGAGAAPCGVHWCRLEDPPAV